MSKKTIHTENDRTHAMPNEFNSLLQSRITQYDLAFTHSVFLQCFLPVRSLKADTTTYEVRHGNALLAIDAGKLIDPNSKHREQREVPAGSKARLLFAYINSQAIRTKQPEIDMGRSLHGFMKQNGVALSGQNGKELVCQVRNIAAAQITLGTWTDQSVLQKQMNVANTVSFWMESSSAQTTLWQPTLQLSPDYMVSLQEHRSPINFGALVDLQASPRAMDVYSWLTYRLYRLRKPARIPYTSLKEVFGQGFGRLRDFRRQFEDVLKAAHRQYPEARVELHKDFLLLRPSPPAIPRNAHRVIPFT